MHIFAPSNNLVVEASEIARNANGDNSDMTSVRKAFNQVSWILENGNFKFNKGNRGNRRADNFDAISSAKHTVDENKLFHHVNKKVSMKSKKKGNKLKKIRSDTGDMPHPYALNAMVSKKHITSENNHLESFDENESNTSVKNIGECKA